MTRGKAGIDPLGDHFTFDAHSSLVAANDWLSAYEFLTDHDIFATVSPDQASAVLQNAQIEPERSVGELSEAELHRLYREIRDTLGRLIEGHHGYDA